MNILILGLGQYANGSGVLASLYFAKRGDDVTVADFYYTPAMDANVRRLKKYKNVKLILGKHATAEVKKADRIIKHQRLRMNEPEVVEAIRLGKPLESELSIFLQECPAPVVGITGTRGKSTTTALTAELLKGTGKRVWLGGNILLSPLDFLSKVKPDDIVVLEISSFQLEGLGLRGISPSVAVWTNLMRDHLNAYPSMAEYAEAKAQIFRHQHPEDVAFLPADRSFNEYATEAPGRVYRFGKRQSPEAVIVKSTKLGMIGAHNQRNAETAVAVALEFKVPVAKIKKTLKEFKGLPNRIEEIAVKKGIRFINDTTSTTPDATMVALKTVQPTVKGNLHLFFGGSDKELEFAEVARLIKKLKPSVYLLPGTAEQKIKQVFAEKKIAFQPVKNMKEAVKSVLFVAKKGDVVLLSPGATSFGLFKNEFDRGEQFKKIVGKL